MRPLAQLDIETFSNWFLVGITDKASGAEWDFQQMDGYPLDVASICQLLQHYTIVTFNGVGYDLPMLAYALTGASCAQLKAANDTIIVKQMKWWDFYRNFNCWPPDYIDHIDVSEPTPGVRVSLKQYACRLSARLVQDSPVNFSLPLPVEHIVDEIHYCRNDRSVTAELHEAIKDRIGLRINLSAKYGLDLRSKSDAQMAEAAVKKIWQERIVSEPEWMTRSDAPSVYYNRYGTPSPNIPKYPHGHTFKPTIAPHIQFVTPYMQEFLQLVRNCDFLISDKEEAIELGYDAKTIKTGVQIPAELKGRDIHIGKTVYRVGIGGLHSQEKSIAFRSVPGRYTLKTADVASYYPSLILNAGMFPPQLGPLFLSIYQGFYNDRIYAKGAVANHAAGTPQYTELVTIRDGVKIFLNGTFGKLWSRFSIFYAPELGVAVTIGGQLMLLMLIEQMELHGIRVISANTDGIEMAVPPGLEDACQQIMTWWQDLTKLSLEHSNYAALFSRDVNNYARLEFGGKVKRKGYVRESGILENKHPDLDICADAVVAFLSRGKPIAHTIMECKDIRKFVRVRGAKGGAGFVVKPGAQPQFLGRAVRWYYSAYSVGHVIDVESGNKVAGSDGARPIMLMDGSMPADINYDMYISTANDMLEDLGFHNIQAVL